MSLTPEARNIIDHAVREMLRRRFPAATDAIRIPVRVRNAEDAQALAVLAGRLARLEPYGALFLQGRIRFDVAFGDGPAKAAAPVAERPAECGAARGSLSDQVLTEAALRRQPARIKEVEIPPRALVTPSARDYARSRGIRIVRGAA